MRPWLRSVLGGLAVTLLGVLGAHYQSVVDRGPEWLRKGAVASSLGIGPFWWMCRQLTPLFHGPTPWLLAGAFLANVAVWAIAVHTAGAVFRRARLR